VAGERELALFNIDGQFYAIDNCPHRGGPLVRRHDRRLRRHVSVARLAVRL